MDDTDEVREVLVLWYCAHGVGPPRWIGTEIYESEECDTEFVDVSDLESLAEELATAECPRCHAELHAGYDPVEAIPGPVFCWDEQAHVVPTAEG